jgi:hypothetical protein
MASAEYIAFASRSTFLGVPARRLNDLGDGDVVIMGAPYDWGTSYRPGARFGPRAIRGADYGAMDGYRPHLPTGIDPLGELGVVDIGDVYVVPGEAETSIARIADTVETVAKAGKVPIVLGGDHTITWPERLGSGPGPRAGQGGADPLRRPRRHRIRPERLPLRSRHPDAAPDRIGGRTRSPLRPDRPPRLLA